MGRTPDIGAHLTFIRNVDEVWRLVEIHGETSGEGRGYKYNVEVLNKSAVVLLVACWEAFVEDLAERAFSILLRRAKTYSALPKKVLAEAAKPLRESADPCHVWRLAGEGWKDVLRKHKRALFERYTGKMNTPRASQVDTLYHTLLGIKAISSGWHWQSMTRRKAMARLEELIDLRGSIAHRVAASRKVGKDGVRRYIDFIHRMAVQTSNTVRDFLIGIGGKEPWPELEFAKR
jgi:hypothetical protein